MLVGQVAGHDLAPRVHAGVGAPGARQLDRLAHDRGDGAGSSPITVRTPGLAAKPWNPAPSYATVSGREHAAE